jgi:hypothetical protein
MIEILSFQFFGIIFISIFFGSLIGVSSVCYFLSKPDFWNRMIK